MTRADVTHAPSGTHDARPAAPRRGWWFRVRGVLPLTLPPLLVAAGLATIGTVFSRASGGAAGQSILWTLTMMAVALAAAALTLSWYSGRRRMVDLQWRIGQLTDPAKAHPVDLSAESELSALANVLNLYVAQLRHRAARLQLQKKELDIQTRIAEAQKRCVETIIERVAEAVLVTDAFDEIVLVNHAAQEVFGFALGTAYRQPIHRVIPNPAFVALVKSMRKPDEPAQRTVRLTLNGDTATPKAFRVSLTRVVDPRGQVYGIVTVLRAMDGAEATAGRTSDRESHRS